MVKDIVPVVKPEDVAKADAMATAKAANGFPTADKDMAAKSKKPKK